MEIRKSVKWFVEHPFWTFVGSILGIVGVVATIYAWIADPVDSELKELEVLLRDALQEASYIAQFSSYSEEKIEGMLGGRSGWESSLQNRIEYAQATVETIRSHQAFSRLTEHGRKAFSKVNSKLDKYKSPRLMNARTVALKQDACGLVMINIREIANLNEEEGLVGCFPVTPDCWGKVFNYGHSIGIEVSECEA